MHMRSAERRTLPPRRVAKVIMFGDVLAELGDVPADRVRFDLKPGRATLRDLIRADRQGVYELVDGFLVRKPMGVEESFLAVELGFLVRSFLETNDLGFLTGTDGPFRVTRRVIRKPDLSFFAWSKVPKRVVPSGFALRVAPDLAVEVLSPSNTKGEIDRKLKEYFQAGVRLTWVIDPKTRAAKVYTSASDFTELSTSGTLDGGDVLPGFKLPLSRLFAKLGPAGKRRKKSK